MLEVILAIYLAIGQAMGVAFGYNTFGQEYDPEIPYSGVVSFVNAVFAGVLMLVCWPYLVAEDFLKRLRLI